MHRVARWPAWRRGCRYGHALQFGNSRLRDLSPSEGPSDDSFQVPCSHRSSWPRSRGHREWLLVELLGSGSSASPSANAVALTPDVQAKLQKVIDDVRVQFKAPGLQAGVWTDNGQWVGTSGVAKAGTTQTITLRTTLRVGSITKTMTGTVILQLIDEGKLSFDDVIDKYVPGMPNGSIATIKNLIEMQSGIPTYTADTAVVNKYSAAPTTAFTPQELVNSVKKSPPMFAPGARFFYSNTNFVLLGMVIEKVTGKSVSDNFSERLFKPLGMNATSAPGTSTSLPDPYLSGITEQEIR